MQIAGLQCVHMRMACVFLMTAEGVLVVFVLSMPVLMAVRSMPVLASSTMTNRYENRLGHQNCGNDPTEE